MKITTWNVNGLRAALNKGIWEWMRQYSPDVICLQEIKARPEQLSDEFHTLVNKHNVYWNPAEKPGYSGVVTLTSIPPLTVEYGIGRDEFDCEGRVIRTKFSDFTLFNVYFPSGQRGLERVEYKLKFYAHLLEILDRLQNAGDKVIVCGDFNTAHNEIDLRYPKQNKNTSGFLAEERAWIDLYLRHGLVDIYRQLFPEKIEYTWWTYRLNARQHNVGWRLDYFLMSEALVTAVKDVVIHSDVVGSDHCPVTLVVDA